MTRAAFLGLLATVACTAPAAAQERQDAVASVRFDVRRAAELLRRSEGRMDVADLLREVASVEVRAGAPGRVLLAVYLMRGANVLERYTAAEFEAPARGIVPLRNVLRDREPPYGRFSVDPDHLLESVELVPARAAFEEPGRFVINGVFPFHPKGWKEMAAIYVVAAPLDGGRVTGTRDEAGRLISRHALAGVGVVFGSATRR